MRTQKAIWLTTFIFSMCGIIFVLFNSPEIVLQDRTRISLVIIGLFVLFLIINISNTVSIFSEWKKINEAAPPEYDYNNKEIIFKGEGLLKENILNVLETYEHLLEGGVDQKPSVDHLRNRLYRKESIVNLGSGLMITLGLIGTIMGLILSMSGLEQVMNSIGNADSGMVSGLQNALSGMGTAFYTTLFGALLGGIILKILSHATGNMMDEIIEIVSLRTEMCVIPFLRKDPIARLEKEFKSTEKLSQMARNMIQENLEIYQKAGETMTHLNYSLQGLKEGLPQANLKELSDNLSSSFHSIEQTLAQMNSNIEKLLHSPSRKGRWNLS